MTSSVKPINSEPLLDELTYQPFDYVLRYGYDKNANKFESISDDPSQVDQTLGELRKAFGTRKTKSKEFRIRQLRNLLKGVEAMKDEICQAITTDLGKDNFCSFLTEYTGLPWNINHALKHIDEWMRPEERPMPIKCGMGRCYIKPEPLGVVCILGTWNVPFLTTLWPLSQVIAAGNCAIIKPSEISPHCSEVIHRLITTYLDPMCYRSIQGKAQVAIKLTQSPFDFIVFSGATEKGKLVA